MQISRGTATALIGLALASCSSGRVRTVQGYAGAPLPPPSEVAVYDFAISPDQVQLDQAPGARLQREVENQSASERQNQAARLTETALAETLSARLQSYGLPVERLPAGATPPPGALLVQGRILSVNEGNRARRLVVGFGAGKSSIEAEARLYYVENPAAPRFLQSFQASSDSGRMPGAAGTMGLGAAAGRVGTSAALSGGMHASTEMRRTGDEENADRLADALARQMGKFAVTQGWIAQTAVR
jgi:hypothetical protein